MNKLKILFFLLLSMSLNANDPKVLVGSSEFPYVFEKSGESFKGVGPDIINMIFKDSLSLVSFHNLAWKRTLKQLELGKLDIVIGTYKTSERSKKFIFTDNPFYEDKIVLYTSVDNKAKWDGSLKSLKEKRVAVVDGWSYGEETDGELVNLNIVRTNSALKCLKIAASERVDYCLMNYRDASGEILKSNLKDLKYDNHILGRAGIYFAFSKKNFDKDLYNKFNQSLNQLLSNGEVDKILKKYSLDK
jgi:polar amino acid transport system substrate-binding protein